MKKPHYAWIIAFTGTLVVLISHGFGRMSYSVILPSMRDALGLTYTQVGLIGTGNFIGYLGLALIGGFLAARFGSRRIIFISLFVMGISLFLTGLSNSFTAAFILRLVTGLATGGSYIPMMALPSAWFAVRKRGLATGINTMGTGFGLSITGLLLPYFILQYGNEGWRFAWYLMGTLAFIGSFACYIFLRDNPAEKGLLMYGGDRTSPPVQLIQTITIFAAWRTVAREAEVWKLGAVYFMFGFSYIIYLTFFIAFLTKEMGMTTKAAGWIFSLIGFLCIFSGMIWGSISDILGRRNGAILAYLALALSYLLPAIWQETHSIYISSMLFGATMSSLPVIMAAASGDAVGGKLAPVALGFITVFFGIAQSLGPAIGGWIKDTTGTFNYAFMLSAGVSLVGALLSLMMKRKNH